jgi:DNA-binding FadR family transcriptional regulator
MWVPFAQEITRRVVSGEYAAASALPTENQFCAEFGVSRTVIREGIRVLIEKGLIRIDRGLGTIALGVDQWKAFDADVLSARLENGDRDVVLRDVLILRKAIEPEFAAGAARFADESGLAHLRACVSDLDDALEDVARYVALDGAFHSCIADISRNSLGRDILRTMERPVAIQRELTSHIPGNPRAAHEHHHAIFERILDRDPEGAWRAMREHLEFAERRLSLALRS